MKKLEPRKRLFVHEYLMDLNGTQATIRAGYSKKGADVQAVRLLANVRIKAAIARAMKQREKKLEITADKWLRELWIIGHSDLKNYVTIDEGGLIVSKTFEEMPEDSSRALEMIEENRTIKESSDGKDSNILNSKIKFKMYSKIEALKLIGQHLGFLKDKVEHSGEVAHTVQFIMPRPGQGADKQ